MTVKGMCSHIGNRAPAKRKRVVLLELANEHARRQTRVAQLLGEEEVHRRGRGPVAARRLERERREVRPRCRAGGVVLEVLGLLRALYASEDVVARIVFTRARLVGTGSTVDELLVGDPHGVGWGWLLVQVNFSSVVRLAVPCPVLVSSQRLRRCGRAVSI